MQKAKEIKVFDANEMKHRLNCHIASAIYRGVDNIQMGKDSSSATEFMRGYERGAIDTANVALGQKLVDAVEVVHARWIFKHNPITDPKGYFIRIVCSNCNLHTGQKSNYCPNCGAKMDGGDGDS